MVPAHHKGKRQIVNHSTKNCGGKNNSDFKQTMLYTVFICVFSNLYLSLAPDF